MEPTAILSAPLDDIIFEGRNKSYGAYVLRRTDASRTKVALAVTIAGVALVLSIVTLANGSGNNREQVRIGPVMELADIKDEQPPEKIPEPEKKPDPEPVRTEPYTPPAIVPDDQLERPLAPIENLDSALFSDKHTEGRPDDHTVEVSTPPGERTGIVEPKTEKEPEEPVAVVDIPAKFNGNWVQFLKRNLNPETPVEHHAPAGRYSVVIRFVVDKEGTVSELIALTHHGYGMEEEALRVLRKAPKWEPAVLNGYNVKAYHKQVIVFEVLEE